MALTLQPIRGCPQHSEETENTITLGDSQKSPLPIFPEGGGTSVYRLRAHKTASFRINIYYHVRLKRQIILLNLKF